MATSCLTHLECARCSERVEPGVLQRFCSCGGTWLARYNLEAASQSLNSETFLGRRVGFWSYPEVSPSQTEGARQGLGEGGTPLIPIRSLPELKLNLFAKDEGINPGGSFKARGMASAVSRAKELGASALALPSAGNAGVAAAQYGAFWNLPVHVALPKETPAPFREAIQMHGAKVYEVDGNIAEAGAWLARHENAKDWFFLSTLKEPYRVEGKKTMGYELVHQLRGRWPEVVIYPTGGGTGIVGMAKADEEMRALGIVSGPPPRFVVVQAEGCAPVVDAFRKGLKHAPVWKNPITEANGLRVPGTIGDHIILDALRETGGTAITVSETEMHNARLALGHQDGIYAAPEAAATLAAADLLRQNGWLKEGAEVALFLTGNGFKYPFTEDKQ